MFMECLGLFGGCSCTCGENHCENRCFGVSCGENHCENLCVGVSCGENNCEHLCFFVSCGERYMSDGGRAISMGRHAAPKKYAPEMHGIVNLFRPAWVPS